MSEAVVGPSGFTGIGDEPKKRAEALGCCAPAGAAEAPGRGDYIGTALTAVNSWSKVVFLKTMNELVRAAGMRLPT